MGHDVLAAVTISVQMASRLASSSRSTSSSARYASFTPDRTTSTGNTRELVLSCRVSVAFPVIHIRAWNGLRRILSVVYNHGASPCRPWKSC